MQYNAMHKFVEYWTILPSPGAYSQTIVQNNFNSVLYTPKVLINLMICRVNNVLHDVQCNTAFLCCITEINVSYFVTGNIQV